jgi:hypothetical protein
MIKNAGKMSSVKDQLDGDFQLEGQIPASEHRRPFFSSEGGEDVSITCV